MKEGFKIVVLHRPRHCSAVRQLKTEAGQEWTERPLRVTQVIRLDGQDAGELGAVKLLRMKNTSTATVHICRSFQSVMKTVLNYVGKFELQYGGSFSEPLAKHLAGNIRLSRYLLKQPGTSYVRYMEFCRLTKRSSDAMSLDGVAEG